MSTMITKFRCVFAAAIVCAFGSGAETEFNRGRTTLIWGVTSREDTDVEVEVSASSMVPGARCVYETKAEDGQYSQDVKLFPGENVVTTRTVSDTYDVYMPCSVTRPSLRVEMRCADRFYHLVVNDWQGYSEEGEETYYQREAAAGLYRISVYHMVEGLELVGYDENGDSIWEEVEPVASLTTVSIFVNDELVHMASNGDGKEVWSVGTVVLHSGDRVGGYAADGKRLDLADQGAVYGMSLGALCGSRCAVTGIWGTNGLNPVFLSVGEAAQFGAQGVLSQLYYGAYQSVRVIECFTSSDESVGSVDALGVFVAKAPGHTQVSCRNYSGDPIDVYVLRGVEMAMDGNRDGEINFDDPDDKRYLFWVNGDCDISHNNEKMWQEDDYGPKDTAHKDWDDKHIGNKGAPGQGTCERDLEDFTRLHIRVDEYIANMPGVTYGLRFESESEEPFVNIFEAVDETDGYLSNAGIAASQVQKSRVVQVFGGGLDYPVDASKIRSDGGVSCFLLEGCHAGKGKLTFVVKKDGAEICKQSVTLELHDIAWFYDVWQARVLAGARWTVEVSSTAWHGQTKGYQPETDEKLLFVHGWNMEGWEKRRWTETVFKRLWWQGYKGSVALFDWPTLDGFDGTWWWDLPFDSRHFDNSEYISWKSSDALNNLITQLNVNGQLRVLAHSQGNVAIGEALRKYGGPPLHTYIASKAAVSAQYFDGSIAASQAAPFNMLALQACDTPDVMANYPFECSVAPYFNGVLSKATRRINFFNEVDYALNTWKHNNAYKPDSLYSFGYAGSTNALEYLNGNGEFYRDPPLPLNRETLTLGLNENQRYRIFAYCAESRSVALGQVISLPFGFTGNWNLRTAMGYDNHHYSHSREFRSSIVVEWLYWQTVFEIITLQDNQ